MSSRDKIVISSNQNDLSGFTERTTDQNLKIVPNEGFFKLINHIILFYCPSPRISYRMF